MGNFTFNRLLRNPLCWIGATIFLAVTLDLLWFCVKFPSGLAIYSLDALPASERPLLVLGAGVRSDGQPTRVLEGRLKVALGLYDEKKINWILVSGDNRTIYYNEPQAMRRWLIRHGVPPDRIVRDYAGRRTYDSLKRTKMIFGQEKIVIATSDFHMARALYLAKNIGIDAYGVPSQTESLKMSHYVKLRFREYLARHKAVWDVWFPPGTRLGPKEDTPDEMMANPLTNNRMF